MRNIVIAKEFSRTPFGRYTTDSPHSAERFRREFLVPALKGTEQEIVVDFRGIALGVGSSFLEEAFGECSSVRKGYLKPTLKHV